MVKITILIPFYNEAGNIVRQLEDTLSTIKKIDSKEIKNNTNIKYTQTFEEKNGFIDGLSILDMIFNCGPKTKDYIKAGL